MTEKKKSGRPKKPVEKKARPITIALYEEDLARIKFLKGVCDCDCTSLLIRYALRLVEETFVETEMEKAKEFQEEGGRNCAYDN